MKTVLASILISLSLALAVYSLNEYWNSYSPASSLRSVEPAYYLWAWRRTEDLSFMDSKTRLALLTGTITLDGHQIRVEPRANPVFYPDNTEVIAVIRIEGTELYDMETANQLSDIIPALGSPFHPVEYQIDFDARFSQRDFYRLLLQQLRDHLDDTALSITALASWCFDDNWIEDLPIDSAVAMIYRMGQDADIIRQKLSSDRILPATICRHNVGYSSDEPLAPVDNLKRIFLYHPQPWTESRFLEFRDDVDKLLYSRGIGG